jgi:drug/metabolite transporter (DMT)-like permease
MRISVFKATTYITLMNIITRLLKNRTVVAGFLYFSIPFGTGIAAFLLGDQEFTVRIVIGSFIASLVNGLTSLKAFFSKSTDETTPKP